MSHEDTIKQLSEQVRGFYDKHVPFRVYHGSTNSTRILSYKRSEMVDVSGLDHVIEVDEKRRVALVEPNVPMDKLVRATLRHGLVPPVVPELPGITVGGAIQGTAAETSSFRYGCFNQTLKWFEIILGNGEVVKASPEKNQDLFYGAAGSYGSLGIITKAEIKLLPAKKYVVVELVVVHSFNEALRLTEQYVESDYDFVGFVMMSKDLGLIELGRMSNRPVGKVRRFSRPWDDWFYLHVRAGLRAEKTDPVTMPIKDYLFRFNRGAFWAAENVFRDHKVPFNRLTRGLLDPLLRTRKLYQALQASAASQVYVCQDLVIPDKTCEEFLEFNDKEFAMYPVGVCPMKPDPRSPLQCNGLDAKLVYNIGVYGLNVRPYEKFVAANRQIEQTAHRLGGKKWLYAQNFYTEAEFWQIYDKKWYDKLRRKYHAERLPDIYSRTCSSKRHDVNFRRAILKTALGQAKLRVTE